MRVFALGGYGKIGLHAVKLLARSDLVTEIAIAGRHLERGKQAAAEIGDKAIAVRADTTDEQKLTSLLEGYDIVMNAAWNDTVIPTIRAAIRTGTQYCDVNHHFIGQALRLSAEAKAAGIAAVVANGYSPGIINLMGVHAARQLDEVEQLQIGFGDFLNFQSGRELTPRQWLEDPQESVAALHEYRPFIARILQMTQDNDSRPVCIYHDGQWRETDPVRNGMDVPMPQGGTTTAYPYVSSEPLWAAAPHAISNVSSVELFFSPLPPQLHDLLRGQALRVLEGEIDSDVAVKSFYDAVESDPHRWLTLPDDFVALPELWVRALGRKEGRAAQCSCWFTAPMWDVEGYSLISAGQAVAVLKMLRGVVRERGVMTAGTAFEPPSFFDEVASLMPESLPGGKLVAESLEWLE